MNIIREIQKSLKSVIQNQALGGIFILKPVGEKTRSITSLHDDISTIGKCICIMGGRMPFAPTIIREIQ